MWKRVLWVCFLIGFLLGYPDGIILGRVNRCELGASDGDSLRNVELAPGLVIWKGTWSKGLNGCELGVSDKVLLGNFQLDPDSVIWKDFWSEIPDGP